MTLVKISLCIPLKLVKYVTVTFVVLLSLQLQFYGFLILYKMFETRRNNMLLIGIYNSRVTKPSYKTEFCITTSQTELLTQKSYFFLIFKLLAQCENSFNIILELETRDI